VCARCLRLQPHVPLDLALSLHRALSTAHGHPGVAQHSGLVLQRLLLRALLHVLHLDAAGGPTVGSPRRSARLHLFRRRRRHALKPWRHFKRCVLQKNMNADDTSLSRRSTSQSPFIRMLKPFTHLLSRGFKPANVPLFFVPPRLQATDLLRCLRCNIFSFLYATCLCECANAPGKAVSASCRL